jgi:hypothetical protein
MEILSDLALSRRLERTEASANAAFVEVRARVAPQSGAQWIEVAGTYAMYDGPRSPSTQTFGLGLFRMPPRPTWIFSKRSSRNGEPRCFMR